MNRRVLGVVAALVVAAGGGFVIGSVLQPVETPPDREARALAAIEAKLDRLLEEVLNRPAAVPEPTREPVRNPVGSDLASLDAKMTEISQRLAELTVSPVAVPPPPAASSVQSLASLHDTLPDEGHTLPAFDSSSPLFARSLVSVLAEFGTPQAINQTSSQLELEYDIDAERAVKVWCNQGVVIFAQATMPFPRRRIRDIERNLADLNMAIPRVKGEEERSRLSQQKAMLEQELAKLKSEK
jgi:hypothetical protein